MRNLFSDLRHIVEAAHGNRCPCCSRVMRPPPRQAVRRPVRQPRDTRTRGHDMPVAYGGNPAIWVNICCGCNGEQGAYSFRQWAGWLARADDPRAAAVARLADTIDGWAQTHGVERMNRHG
jgi:hypothetical protein